MTFLEVAHLIKGDERMKLFIVLATVVSFISLNFFLTEKLMANGNQIPAFARLAAFALAENAFLAIVLIAAIVEKKVKEGIKKGKKKAAKEALEIYGKALVEG